MRPAILLLLGLAACGQRTSPRETPSNQAPDAGGAAASPYRCDSADDCTLALLAGETDCCENACEKTPYHVDELADLRDKAQAHCADKVEECTKRECKRARNLVPACDDGACVAVELPRATACTRDDECTLACDAPGQCCGDPCSACEHAWHVDDHARADQWRAAECGACAEQVCTVAEKTTAVARCVDNRCTAVEP
jgi:hypothetical protein